MQKILIIGFVWPEPNSSAAGGRMAQLIKLFINKGWEITFASSAMNTPFMLDLEKLGVKKKAITLNCSSFDVFVKDLNPSIVLFDRFMIEEQFGWRVAENCPNALRLLDTEDLHCLRYTRQKAFKGKKEFNPNSLLIEDITKREIASILRCDITLIVSEVEIKLLQTLFKIDSSLLFYIPLLIEENIKDRIPYKQRKDFMFIGNFLHEPNWNTVQYLKETIWPLIKEKLPNINLNIYGAYPSQKVLQLHNPKERFLIKGRIESAQPVIEQSLVMLAPIRFGAGIKGKLLESMHYGTPSITTSIGSESMKGDLNWNGYIEDDPHEIAKCAIKLYSDEGIWRKAQENGFEIIENRYLQSLFANDFIEYVFNIQKNLNKHRLNNFMGSMMQYHMFASTKYMSKWIESKNEK